MKTRETRREKWKNPDHWIHYHQQLIFLVSFKHLWIRLDVAFTIETPQEELSSTPYRSIDEEKKEKLMISDAYTVSHPWTVMIHS